MCAQRRQVFGLRCIVLVGSVPRKRAQLVQKTAPFLVSENGPKNGVGKWNQFLQSISAANVFTRSGSFSDPVFGAVFRHQKRGRFLYQARSFFGCSFHKTLQPFSPSSLQIQASIQAVLLVAWKDAFSVVNVGISQFPITYTRCQRPSFYIHTYCVSHLRRLCAAQAVFGISCSRLRPLPPPYIHPSIHCSACVALVTRCSWHTSFFQTRRGVLWASVLTKSRKPSFRWIMRWCLQCIQCVCDSSYSNIWRREPRTQNECRFPTQFLGSFFEQRVADSCNNFLRVRVQ